MRLFLLGLSLLAAVIVGSGFYAVHVYEAPGPLAADCAIVVPRGGIGHVAAVLKQQGVIPSEWQFEAAALATRAAGTLKSAELEFPPAPACTRC